MTNGTKTLGAAHADSSANERCRSVAESPAGPPPSPKSRQAAQLSKLGRSEPQATRYPGSVHAGDVPDVPGGVHHAVHEHLPPKMPKAGAGGGNRRAAWRQGHTEPRAAQRGVNDEPTPRARRTKAQTSPVRNARVCTITSLLDRTHGLNPAAIRPAVLRRRAAHRERVAERGRVPTRWSC